MNSIDFENDISIIYKTHNLTIKRNKKEIKLILLYHNTYGIIEIKILENNSHKIIGRELLDYSDIFLLFNNYFICFNENMQKIFDFINNCINLKKYDININENDKTINLELYILKENNMIAKTICITSSEDKEKWALISKKIQRYNDTIITEKTNLIAPFLNYIKYENNFYYLYMDIYIEKEIEILVFKVKLVNKLNINREEIFAGFYSRDDIELMSKYFESISNINEISDDIKINLANKNLKIESITEGKIKIALSVLSSVNQKIIIFDLIKGADIKDKYIQIIKELKFKNKLLLNNEIYLNSTNILPIQKINKNNNIINNNNNNPLFNNSNRNTIDESNKEENMIGKKRKRFEPIKKSLNTNKEKNKEKQENKGNSSLSNSTKKFKKNKKFPQKTSEKNKIKRNNK